MKKITEYDIAYVDRNSIGKETKLGIIFSNATAGHFLYTFYSSNPDATLYTSRLDRYGTAHNQNRDFFDFDANSDDQSIASSSSIFQKDFLAHWKNDTLSRQYFSDYYLIGIQPSPETVLLHTYMIIFKVDVPLEIQNNTSSTGILTKPKDHQFDYYNGLFKHISSYNYQQKNFDILYNTSEIFYQKTVNTRLKKYRILNRQHVDNYINFFQQFETYFTEDFKKQYEFEKNFLDKNREKLYI